MTLNDVKAELDNLVQTPTHKSFEARVLLLQTQLLLKILEQLSKKKAADV